METGFAIPMTMRIEELARQWTAAQPGVAIFISSLIPDPHDAQDILQDVAAAIFSHDFSSSGPPESFKAWAIGIARHKALDFYRRKGRHSRPVLLDDATMDQLALANEQINDEIDLRRDALRDCLGKLPQKSRQLLDLRYQSSLPVEEIAARSKAGVSAIKMALHRIRVALRDCVERRLAQGAEGA